MFTKKELKLIEEALLAYGIEPEETKIYSKIDKLINKPVETTNEQPKCKIPHKGRKWCSVYKGICKCYSKKG